MKITKYPQSCLTLEKDGARILIDPGNLALDAFPLARMGAIDAVLYTHRHADHCDPRSFEDLRELELPLYGNQDVCALVGDGITPIRDGEAVRIATFDVLPRDLPHAELVDGSAGPPNTGFIIDQRFFHPGDGVVIDGVKVDILAVPIAGPSISARDAYKFLSAVEASVAIPIHYDYFIEDPDLIAGSAAAQLARFVVLGHGESAEF